MNLLLRPGMPTSVRRRAAAARRRPSERQRLWQRSRRVSTSLSSVPAARAACWRTGSPPPGEHRLLLLEAGPDSRHPWLHIPVGYGRLFTDRRFNWCYATEPQPHCHDRQVIVPRGKVLGGSSAINGLIYIRGQVADFDHWRQLGNVAGATRTCSPISARRRTTSAAPTPSMARAAGSACPTCATSTHWRKPSARRRSSAAIEQRRFQRRDPGGCGLLPEHDPQRRELVGGRCVSQARAADRPGQRRPAACINGRVSLTDECG